MTNNYSYADDQLTQVSHSAPSGTVAYDFSYNSLGWSTGVKVSGAAQNLSTYSLQARTGRLNSLTYGNGQTINYTYDSNDQLKKVSQGTTDLYAFEYDNSDNLGYQKDLVQNKEYWYEYDSLERLGKIRSKDSAGNLSWSQYGFNTANSLSTFTESILGTLYTTSFSYDNDSRPTSISFGDYSKILTYDSQNLNRTYQSVLQNSGTDIYRTQVNYVPGDGTTSTQSYRVYQVINDVGRTNETLTYSYDDRGYITKVSQDSNNYSDYRYDGFGQLIRENYKWGATSYSKVYSYDEGGNISQKVRYAFVDGDGTLGTPLETIGYGYSDSVWKDKLTSYNGSTITYDEIGNPISDGTWSYTWTQGRKLQQISKSGTTASYKYNSDGIRTEKTVNGVTTVYNVVGGQVTWEKTGSNNPIYYLYDASGVLWGLKYTDNSMYFYVRNAQGDITKIVNKDGNEVVAYAYDAWGNLMSTTGSLASTLGVDNPYRYRGYRVDNETGLYSLSSRYYNPEIGRFINADDVYGVTGDLSYSNVFAYCGNNPVMYQDPGGHFFMLITGLIGAIAGGIVGAAVSYATTGKVTLKSVLIGAAIGGAIGLTGGAAASLLATGGTTALASTGTVVTAYGTWAAGASTVVYASWQKAEQGLRSVMNSVQEAAKRTFDTPFGSRVADAFSVGKRLLGESKYGYQGLSKFIKNEIAKDLYLIKQGYKVEWHFYWSQVSNSGGPSGPLRKALQAAGITIIEHFTR